jgi:hypothetical protein
VQTNGLTTNANHVNDPERGSAGKVSSPADPTGLVPGYKSTEFWLTVLIIGLLVVGDLAELLPPKVAAALVVIQGALYKVVRLALKWRAGSLSIEALAQQPSTPAKEGR